MRAELCACGGLIVAPNLDESAPAVRLHNGTSLHQEWRRAGGLEIAFRPSESALFLKGVCDSQAIEELQHPEGFYHTPVRRDIAWKRLLCRS